MRQASSLHPHPRYGLLVGGNVSRPVGVVGHEAGLGAGNLAHVPHQEVIHGDLRPAGGLGIVGRDTGGVGEILRLGLHPGDKTVAVLTYDGCTMGVKSLSAFLNKYEAAEERAKDIAKKLIAMEDKLAEDMRGYL